MYDRAETAAANDRLWQLVRAELGFGPAALTRSDDLWGIWAAPDLLLAQTCSLPYRLRLRGKVQLVGCPEYRLPGCPPGYYNSVLIARKSDPRAPGNLLRARVVINQDHSQSGYGALSDYAAEREQPLHITGKSGGHMRSADMVAGGDADLASIDAMSWRLIKRHDPQAAALREVDRTAPTPAMPFITGLSQDPLRIAEALGHAITKLSPQQRDILSLYGLQQVPESQISALGLPPARHFAQGNAS